MNNTKTTKRALLSSVLAMLLCAAMLIGTTFAWFTDSASTAVNKIQAGTLDVALEMKDNSGNWVTAEGKTLQFKVNGQIPADGTQILWEPGCTYVLPELRVVNNGNLALKYKIVITGINGDAKLNEVIDWTITGTEVSADGYTHLPAGISNQITIKGSMKTTAGNEYQGLSIDGIAITVYATQDAVEIDSFDNTYDKDATDLRYPSGVTAQSFEAATSVEYTNNLGETVTGNKPAVAAYVDSQGNVKYVGDIFAAVKSGAKEIYCKQNVTLKMRVNDTNRSPDLTDNLTIYANGADFQYGEISMNMTAAGKAAPITLKVYGAKNIKVWGLTPNDGVTQTIVMENCTNIGQGRTQDLGILMYITGNTGTVNATVKDCYVTANSSGIYMSTNGSLTVTGSTFVDCATGIKSSYKGAGTRTDRIENCVFTSCGCTADMAGDTAWLKNDSAAYKYKKSDGATGTISLTTKGNTITGTIGDKGDTQIANDVNLTESPVTVVAPITQDAMNTGITGSSNKDVTVVMPANSSFTLDNGIANGATNIRDITFRGNGTQTVDVITNAVTAEGGELNYQRGSSFTFENLTIQAGEGSFDGIVCDELTYINCTIKGKLTLFGKATFINCTFENDMANQYSIWTWGGTDVKFEKCTFNTNGKAILLYGSAPTNLVVNNCIFNDRNNGAANKAAIEIGNDYNATYTLTVNNATVNGFAAGQNTGSKLWANKNSMDAAHLTVTIDGSQIQ